MYKHSSRCRLVTVAVVSSQLWIRLFRDSAPLVAKRGLIICCYSHTLYRIMLPGSVSKITMRKENHLLGDVLQTNGLGDNLMLVHRIAAEIPSKI